MGIEIRLFLLGMLILLVVSLALLWYVNSKIAMQDHKLNSMASLIQLLGKRMTDKCGLIENQDNVNPVNLEYSSQLVNNDMIVVSDNEDDEEYNDSVDEDDDISNDDTDDMSEEMNEFVNDDELVTDYINDDTDKEDITEDVADISELDLENVSYDEVLNEHNVNNDNVNNEENVNNEDNVNNDDIKVVKINDIDEDVDYKKMNITKLRELASSLTPDVSKLKKHDLVKLLEDAKH